jgi:hypothetical protein
VGDSTPLNIWDVGVADLTGLLSPINSVLSTQPNALGGEGYNASATNSVTAAPTVGTSNAVGFAGPFNLQLQIAPMRINFRFRVTAIVNIGLPANAVGDYHITTGSPAAGIGVTQVPAASIQPPFSGPIFAPTFDIYGVSRTPVVDAGAAQAPRSAAAVIRRGLQ